MRLLSDAVPSQVTGGGGGTTPTITARTNGSNGTALGETTFTTASFTPTANSKLYVFAIATNENHGGTRNWSASGGGLTWTNIAEPVLRDWTVDGSYDTNCCLLEADVGGSPSSMTVTVDPNASTGDDYYMSWAVFDVSGGTPDHVQSAQAVSEQESNGNSETLAVSLGGNATSGSLVVACFGVFGTGSGACAIPSGWTELVGQTQTYTHVSVFHRDDFSGSSVACTDLGDSVGVSTATIIELIG